MFNLHVYIKFKYFCVTWGPMGHILIVQSNCAYDNNIFSILNCLLTLQDSFCTSKLCIHMTSGSTVLLDVDSSTHSKECCSAADWKERCPAGNIYKCRLSVPLCAVLCMTSKWSIIWDGAHKTTWLPVIGVRWWSRECDISWRWHQRRERCSEWRQECRQLEEVQPVLEVWC